MIDKNILVFIKIIGLRKGQNTCGVFLLPWEEMGEIITQKAKINVTDFKIQRNPCKLFK